MQYENEEHGLLDRIQSSKSVAERDAFVAELETVPTWRRTFYSRWLFIHDVIDVYYECSGIIFAGLAEASDLVT
jgi:hypothetical protein